MKTTKFLTTVFLLFVLQSCSNDGVLFNRNNAKRVCEQEIIEVAVADESGISDPEGVTTHIAAQILSSVFKHYKELGMTEDDFTRLPPCDFTDNLKLLYSDLKLVLNEGKE